MRVGTIVYATNSGLGILAKDFYDNGIITDVLIQSHGTYKDNMHWYKNSPVLSPVKNIAIAKTSTPKHKKDILNMFIEQVDILLLFEIEWYGDVIQQARKKGKKVVLMPMYECTPFPIFADCYLTTSDLDHEYYLKMYGGLDVRRINVPANSSISWTKRSKAQVFIHNAGNSRPGDRNGTSVLLEAVKYIKAKNIKIKIRSQHDIAFNSRDKRVVLDTNEKPFHELWEEGDVFLFPERWNGLSLPIQEAYASGMLVMCGNRSPMNKWLPIEPLIEVCSYQKKAIVPNIPFLSANYDPRQIARKIDEFSNQNIEKYSIRGKQWLEENNWGVMKKKYNKILEEVYES